MSERAVVQVMLSPDQLQAGLGALPPTDVPDTYLTRLAREPADLEPRGFHFQESFDNLDRLQVAVVRLAEGPRLALVRHAGSAEPGIELLAPDDSAASYAAASRLIALLYRDV